MAAKQARPHELLGTARRARRLSVRRRIAQQNLRALGERFGLSLAGVENLRAIILNLAQEHAQEHALRVNDLRSLTQELSYRAIKIAEEPAMRNEAISIFIRLVRIYHSVSARLDELRREVLALRDRLAQLERERDRRIRRQLLNQLAQSIAQRAESLHLGIKSSDNDLISNLGDLSILANNAAYLPDDTDEEFAAKDLEIRRLESQFTAALERLSREV